MSQSLTSFARPKLPLQLPLVELGGRATVQTMKFLDAVGDVTAFGPVLRDTHAARINTNPNTQPYYGPGRFLGYLFFETDTNSAFISVLVAGVPTWLALTKTLSCLQAFGNADLTLTALFQDMPGVSVTLPSNGNWLLIGGFSWETTSADGFNQGRVLVNGAQAGVTNAFQVAFPFTFNPATGSGVSFGGSLTAQVNEINAMTQAWLVTNNSGSVVAKLQAFNNSPVSGLAKVFGATSNIVAIGPF